MNEEEAFQAALDANPDDWQTRLVFADWLQERNDPRAEGYRVLGTRRHRPGRSNMSSRESQYYGFTHGSNRGSDPVKACPGCWIPKTWFNRIEMVPPGNEYWTWKETRREAEDAAALAFSRLSARRRAELLTGKRAEQTVATPKRETKPKKKPKGKK
jgi:uncharacterized protein (TIGR02996 family)